MHFEMKSYIISMQCLRARPRSIILLPHPLKRYKQIDMRIFFLLE